MRDEKLFELAITLVIARIHSANREPTENEIHRDVLTHWMQFRKMWDENGIESGQA